MTPEKVQVLIREITTDDAPAAAALSAELGYPASVEAITARIEFLTQQRNQVVFVACCDGEVRGWVDVVVVHHLASDSRAEIAGLVVSAGMRSRGIGRLLVARAEQWAKGRGFKEMLVRSRSTRENAHRFYLREGYTRMKLSVVFTKTLD